MGDDWTALETAKLVVAILVPVVVVVAGLFVSTLVQRQTSQKLIEKRIAVFDLLAPDYNLLLVYLLFRGAWKETSPPDIIALKRRVDRNMHIYSWLFVGEVQNAHEEFISACFSEFRGPGEDAGIRSTAEKRRAVHPAWNPAWNSYFTNEAPDERDKLGWKRSDLVQKRYQELMQLITAELKSDAEKHPFKSANAVTHG